jgi:AraC-like DNA-binding protein
MTFATSLVSDATLVNIARYLPGATYGPRVMTTFEFIWMLEGSSTWDILDMDDAVVASHRLTPGVVALSTLGTSERYRWDPVRPSAHAFVHFELPHVIDASSWPRTRAMSDCPPLGALANALVDIALAGERTAHRRTEQMIGLMLDLFLDPPLPSAGAGPDVTDRAIMAVRARWAADGLRIVGIEQLADDVGVSAGYLSRSFAARFGLGPSAALELIRLGRAAVALQRSSSTLARIAAECGFTDEFHLSRRFRRVYGLPPGAYRRTRPPADPLSPIIERKLMPLWNGLVARA